MPGPRLASRWLRAHSPTPANTTAAVNARNLGGKPASAYASSGCPSDMVTVGPTCIDRYEASVWSSPTGGTQYGVTSFNNATSVLYAVMAFAERRRG